MLVRILVVDDDRKVLGLVRDSLSLDGFKVDCAESGDLALQLMSKRLPDLLILDRTMPERSGMELCGLLRKDPKTAGLPILMLTAVSEVKKKVDALETGVDDYLTKPFHLSELKARVRALLRRKTPWLVQARPIEFKDLSLDPMNYKAYVQKRDVGLTKLEFEILYLLAVNAGNIIQRSYIESRALDIDYPTDSRSLDVHMSHIREKLGPGVSGRLETARGLGYVFSKD